MPDQPKDDLQEITEKDGQYNKRMDDAQKAVRELLRRAGKDVKPEPESQQEVEVENEEELEDEGVEVGDEGFEYDEELDEDEIDKNNGRSA